MEQDLLLIPDITETTFKILAQVVILCNPIYITEERSLSFKNSQEMTHEPMLLKETGS